MIKKHAYILVLLWVFLAAHPSQAQNRNIEINLDVLENYEPPPMFEDPTPLLTPMPVKKPKPVVIQKTKAIIIENPPIPPRRPKILHASRSFVEKARQEIQEPLKPQSLQKSDYTNIPESDYLNSKLEEPTVEEVLASIDPEAEPIDIIEPSDHSLNKITLDYQPGTTALPEKVKSVLIGEELENRSMDTLFEVRAYASAADEGQSSARRISLARALEIRSFLIEQNIEPNRIILRPLGTETKTLPVDRVDIFFVEAGS